MSRPRLSVVVPLHNEGRIVGELAARLDAAARETGAAYEVVLVNDASTDDTLAQLHALSARFPALRVVELHQNQGQFGAARAGLAAARGELRLTLDGDLQDPPEVIPELCAALDEAADLVLGVKRSRGEGWAFRAVRGLYGLTQHVLGDRGRLMAQAGSFCLMRADVARRVAAVPLRWGNVGVVAGLLAATTRTAAYDKAARHDQRSRVGWRGLIREGLAALTLTGALRRLALVVAGGALALGALGGWSWGPAALGVGALAAVGASAAGAAVWRRERSWRKRLGG